MMSKADRSAGLGYVVGTMDNGDKMYVRIQSTATMKNGNMLSADGGTGKLKGIKGRGTFKGAAAADGTASYDVVGVYQLPK